METSGKNSQIDQLERALAARIAERLANPAFGGDPTYVMALRHAQDIVRVEAGIIRREAQ